MKGDGFHEFWVSFATSLGSFNGLPLRTLTGWIGDHWSGRACLTSVGLSSVPTWCKPYEVLSVGERLGLAAGEF